MIKEKGEKRLNANKIFKIFTCFNWNFYTVHFAEFEVKKHFFKMNKFKSNKKFSRN